jgi:hypothetical protein
MALSDDLDAYYSLDEASGNAIDAHAAFDLTQSGTIGSVAGKVGNARDFERSAGDEYFDGGAIHNFGDTDFSIVGWMNLDDKTTTQTLASRYGGAADRTYGIDYLTGTDRFRFFVTANGTDLVTVLANSFGSPSATTWYMIAARHDSVNNFIRISVNAGTVDSTAHATGLYTGGTAAFLMAAIFHGAIANLHNGPLDEVGVWGRHLSDAEITQLYNGGSGMSYSDITAVASAPELLMPQSFIPHRPLWVPEPYGEF